MRVNSIKGPVCCNRAAGGYFHRLRDIMKTTTRGVDQRQAQRVGEDRGK